MLARYEQMNNKGYETTITDGGEIRREERKIKKVTCTDTCTGTHLGEENRKRVIMLTKLHRAFGILYNEQKDGLTTALISINIIRLKNTFCSFG